MNQPRQPQRPTDARDTDDDLRALLDTHRQAYQRLECRRPLRHERPVARLRAWRLAPLLAASLATVFLFALWPSDAPQKPAPLASGRPSAPITLRPEPVRLTGLTGQTRVQAPLHQRVTRIRFRPPQRPTRREG